MKSYTDLEQSKKLAEILPSESADMEYLTIKENGALVASVPFVKDDSEVEDSAYSHTYDRIPCWSLTALLKILPIFTEPTAFSVNVSVPSVTKIENGWLLKYDGDFTLNINNGKDSEAPVELLANNPIDAAFQMVCWLKENNKL